MDSIYEAIIETFKRGMEIPLIEGGFDVYLESSQTYFRDNPDVVYDAIHYELGKNGSKKRVTRHFIELTYKYYINNSFKFPNRNWYKNHPNELMKFEQETRGCNFSVTRGLIEIVLKNNEPFATTAK